MTYAMMGCQTHAPLMKPLHLLEALCKIEKHYTGKYTI